MYFADFPKSAAAKKTGRTAASDRHKRRWTPGLFCFFYGQPGEDLRLVNQSFVQQRASHASKREAGVVKQVQPGTEARVRRRVAKTGFEMLLRDQVVPKHMISGAQQRLGQRDIVRILRF